ncbi:unnamed protein product [Mytilus edulis]|uniref:Uncharacterized protein n=1 Tax=Mytilus edulis TaxID=6550 RepID=A0A8S3TZ48_MYTED|nr:unnamed protein product [Mytilus edulis]
MNGRQFNDHLSSNCHVIFVGLICLSCDRANITDCLGQKVSCDTDEKCFLDKVIVPDLSTVFSAGCRSKQVCYIIDSAVGKRDAVACYQCCNSPPNSEHVPCNGYLCNQAPRVGGVSCGVCDRVSDPKECAVEQQCQPNEVCDRHLKEYKNLHTVAVGKRADHGDLVLCMACCDGTGCNKDYCQNVVKRKCS